MWCEFFRTVHMLLLNVLSSSTISFYSHPRPLLPKLANSRPPLFLLVHKLQPSPSLNQRIGSTEISTALLVIYYSTPSLPTTDSESLYARTYAIVEIRFKPRIYKNPRWRNVRERGQCMHGALLDGESGVFVGRIDAEAKNVGCLQSLSPLEFCFNLFFGQDFLVCYGYIGH